MSPIKGTEKHVAQQPFTTCKWVSAFDSDTITTSARMRFHSYMTYIRCKYCPWAAIGYNYTWVFEKT